jgi:perosamine synthetase
MIPVNTPDLTGNEDKYLQECIRTGWISSEGPFVRQFETQMAECVGRHHGISVVNGTAALDVAVAALGIGPGDEVIMPAFTIISCAASIVRAGATPVLVDVDPRTWNMNVDQIEDKISPRTKAIMAVHIYGLPVDLDPVMEIIQRHGLNLIEDAAEAHGLTYKGRPCGGFGDISIFSFYANKLITTGEGGMVLTNDDELAQRCRKLRNLCFKPEKRFEHDELGWNYRMGNVQAALGVAQLERLAEFVERKRWMGRRYTELLSDLPSLQLPLPRIPEADNVYWVYGVVLKDTVNFDASEAMRQMRNRGIGTRPFFWPLHEQPALLQSGLFHGEKFPASENIARRGFYLPSGLALKDDDIRRVADAVREVCA